MIDWEPYRKLAVRLAARFRPSGIMAAEDYEAVALTALWTAAQRFDPGRGVKFETYAYHYVTGECKRALRDRGVSGVSSWAYERGERFRPLNISDLDEVDEDKLKVLRDPGTDVEGEATECVVSEQLWAEVDKLRDNCYNGRATRQPDVLRRVYLNGDTLAEAGRSIGLSSNATWAAHGKALKRLRENPRLARLVGRE